MMNIWRIFTPTEFLLLIAKGIPLLHKLDDFYWLLFEKKYVIHAGKVNCTKANPGPHGH